MKKLVAFTFFTFFFFSISYCQLEKGLKIRTVSAGLKLDAYRDSYNGWTYANFNALLDYKSGRFIAQNFVLGGELGVTFNASTDGGMGFSGVLGGFTRYYLPTKSTVYPFFEGGLGLGANLGDISEGFLVRAKVGPGLGFRIGENIMIDTQLQYVLNSVRNESKAHGLYYTMGVAMLLPSK